MRLLLLRMNEKLFQVEKVICALLLFMVFVVTLWGIFERFVLKGGFGWSDELARYINMYCIFFGACLGVMKGAHVGVDVFIRLIPARFHKFFGGIAYTVSCAFCIAMAVTGYTYFLRLQASEQISPAMQVPICWVFFAIPLGCALMALHYFLRLATGDIDVPEAAPSAIKEAAHE